MHGAHTKRTTVLTEQLLATKIQKCWGAANLPLDHHFLTGCTM